MGFVAWKDDFACFSPQGVLALGGYDASYFRVFDFFPECTVSRGPFVRIQV